MRDTRLGMGILAVMLFAAPGFAAKPLTFDYANDADSEVDEEYSSDGFTIQITGVNRLDYDYEVKVMGVPGGPGGLPSLPGIQSPGGPKKAGEDPCKDAEPEAKKKADELLKARVLVFGEAELKKWAESLAVGLQGECDAARKVWAVVDGNFKSVEASWQMTLDSATVAMKTKNTGPGWIIVISVSAKPRLTQFDDKGALVVQSDTEKVLKGYTETEQEKITDHTEKRTFKIRLKPALGIRSSFGPFITSLGRTEYARVANPEYDPTSSDPEEKSPTVIGLKEDSDIGYGIAAFWGVPVWERPTWSLGFSWGIAYTAERELDQAIAGLVGVQFGFADKPISIHCGAAVGREGRLAGGRKVGDPIGQNEEIPLTTSTEISAYFGLGFGF